MPEGKRPEENGSGISRRDFFKTSTAGAVSTALISKQGMAAPGEVTKFGPDPVKIKLIVNGKGRGLKVEPRVTLLDALRNELDVTGPKKVCDRATCGACTVLMDGKPVYACSILAIEAEGKQIVTAEGLGSPDKMHPIQKAFVENDAQQCGFCTPGFVVACQSFLEENPNPSVKDIEEGLGGNLCRCGTYKGIREAVLETAAKGGIDA